MTRRLLTGSALLGAAAMVLSGCGDGGGRLTGPATRQTTLAQAPQLKLSNFRVRPREFVFDGRLASYEFTGDLSSLAQAVGTIALIVRREDGLALQAQQTIKLSSVVESVRVTGQEIATGRLRALMQFALPQGRSRLAFLLGVPVKDGASAALARRRSTPVVSLPPGTIGFEAVTQPEDGLMEIDVAPRPAPRPEPEPEEEEFL